MSRGFESHTLRFAVAHKGWRLITVFLDESGTHLGSHALLAGAVVTPDPGILEHEVVKLHAQAMADPLYWETDEKRSEFAVKGFHHSDDNVALRNFFVSALRGLDFRAHVAFSRRASGLDDEALLINMYYTLVRNIRLRYRTEEVDFVFENESRMDSIYGKIAEVVKADLADSIGVTPSFRALIASKSAPALGVIDYVLAIAAAALNPEAKPYQRQQFNAGLPAHLAHLIDFDRRVHQSARKGIELL